MTSDREIFAFVLMPFDPSFNDFYKFGIKKTAEELDIVAERVDEQLYSEGILERIYNQIEHADIIIADLTGQKANVFYELGYSHAKGKICIHITDRADNIPFDLKHRRHIAHGGSIEKLASDLKDELSWAIGEIENIKKSHIKVNLRKTTGVLDKTKYLAIGRVNFKVDLANDSDRDSPDIEAAYIYMGNGWTVKQDGKECPSKKADYLDYSLMHFIKIPVRKLRKDSWAQINFESEKVIANALRGDDLKDEYKLTGRITLRIVTSKGNFDYEVNVNIDIDEIPF